MKHDIIIIGSGPAGIFTALELVKQGRNDIIMLDKGRNLERRECPRETNKAACARCTHCSLLSGWGGAGAFSDGKLTLSDEVGGFLDQYLSPQQLSDLIRYVDDIYLSFGAPQRLYGTDEEAVRGIAGKAVRFDLRLVPFRVRHLGTGYSQKVLKKMYDFLAERGVKIEFDVQADEILVENGRAAGVKTRDGKVFEGGHLVVAPGREGSAWLAEQARKLRLEMAINPVDIGVRVELPAEIMSPLTDAVFEAKFVFYSRTFEDRVRTFCMCPRGEVVLENNGGIITVNGHSHAERKTGNTNFAILVSKTFTHPFNDPISYGKYIAYLANLLGEGVIVQKLGDLKSGRRSTPERIKKGLVRPTLPGATPGDLSLVLPYRHLTAILEMLQALDGLTPGVASRNTLLYGAEVKFYSSRPVLDKNLETRIKNLFTIGDGAGVTRGLLQASISGVTAAKAIAGRAVSSNH
ncbi:MAG: NAD(P)/FAD-dependent oxidoreductase [Bacillota bacterium]